MADVCVAGGFCSGSTTMADLVTLALTKITITANIVGMRLHSR